MASMAATNGRTFESRIGSFERRNHRRKTIYLDSLTCMSPSATAAVKVIDISESGCKLLAQKGDFYNNQCLTFSIKDRYLIEGIVRWSQDRNYGIEFLSPITEEMISEVA
jgi:hypothetical protein